MILANDLTVIYIFILLIKSVNYDYWEFQDAKNAMRVVTKPKLLSKAVNNVTSNHENRVIAFRYLARTVNKEKNNNAIMKRRGASVLWHMRTRVRVHIYGMQYDVV